MIIEHAKGISRFSSLLSLVCIVIQTGNQQSLKTCPFRTSAHITLNACLPTQTFLWLTQVDYGHSDTPSLPTFYTYKAILRPIWTYGIELWECIKPSNTKILQKFQSKMLIMISSAPWYVSNQNLHSDSDIPYVTEVVRINANKYKTRSTEHSNQLIRALLNPSVDRRLKRLWPEDLAQ